MSSDYGYMTNEEMIENLNAVFNDLENYKLRWFYIFIMERLKLDHEWKKVCIWIELTLQKLFRRICWVMVHLTNIILVILMHCWNVYRISYWSTWRTTSYYSEWHYRRYIETEWFPKFQIGKLKCMWGNQIGFPLYKRKGDVKPWKIINN